MTNTDVSADSVKDTKEPKTRRAVVLATAQSAEYSGPLPHPALMKGYHDINPAYADAIMKMAENNNEANIYISRTLTAGEMKQRSRGQWLAFIIVLLGYGMAALFGFVLKNTPATITSIITGTFPIAIAAIKGLLVTDRSEKE